MRYIDIDDLQIKPAFYSNYFSDVYECQIENKRYILKRFKSPDFLFSNGFEEKLDVLYKSGLKWSIVPQYVAISDGRKIGYITRYIPQNYFSSIFSLKKSYESLKNVETSILELHENGIIHGDVHFGNVLHSNKRDFLNDFDNSEILNHKVLGLDIRQCSSPVKGFLYENGLVKNVDIFMHNILTFSELNDLHGECLPIFGLSGLHADVVKEIRTKKYGVFKDKNSRKICDDIVEFKANNFLIDYIDPSDIKKYGLNRLK